MTLLNSLNRTQITPTQIRQLDDDNEGRDQWVQLLPKGPVIETKDNRGPYKLLDEQKVIECSFLSSGGEMLPVDYSHALDLAEGKGIKTPASGWIKHMEVRDTGIWALIQWTPIAYSEIQNREFRFISPVIAHSPENEIKGVLRASLTNNPNLTMVALNAAQGVNAMNETEFIDEVRRKLSLDGETDFPNMLNEIDKLLQSNNAVDLSKYVPIELFQKTLGEVRKRDLGISLQAAQHLVQRDLEEGALLPFMRDWAVSLCSQNRDAYDEFKDGIGQPVKKFCEELFSPAIDVAKMHARDMEKREMVSSDISKNMGLTDEDIVKYEGKE